jgi:hypothetical protein
MSHLTPHTSHLTPHTSHLTPHTSHVTPHSSPLSSDNTHLDQSTHRVSRVASTLILLRLEIPLPLLRVKYINYRRVLCLCFFSSNAICHSNILFQPCFFFNQGLDHTYHGWYPLALPTAPNTFPAKTTASMPSKVPQESPTPSRGDRRRVALRIR